MNPYLDIIIRSLSVYAFMILAIRLFGKNQLSQLNAGDVVLLLLISNAVQNAMVGENTSLSGGITAAVVLFLANFLVKRFLFENQRIRRVIQGDPVVLINNGILDQTALNQVKITQTELLEAIHEHGIENATDVKLAILEVDGNISVIALDKTATQSHYSRHKLRLKRKLRNL